MITEKEAIALLKKHSTSEDSFRKVFSHSKKVQEIALRNAGRIPEADKEFIQIASLLHDIGRFKHPPGTDSIKHGIAGAEIMRKEGHPEFSRVCECHLGAGISKEDVIKHKLPLPIKDYIPETVEEKIICDADTLVFGQREATIEEAAERFRKEIGEDCARKVLMLNKEIALMIGKKK